MAYDLTPSAGRQTVTALFESTADAERARADLIEAGFAPDAIVTRSAAEDAATQAAKEEPAPSQSVLKSLLDIFIFMPPHEAPTYEEALRRGGIAVAVQTEPGTYERAIDILDRDGAINLDEREAEWQAEGWSPGAPPARPGGPGSAEQAAFEGQNSHDPLVNPAANRDMRERIGVGTSDMTAATDLDPPSAADEPGVTLSRDLSHGRSRVRSYRAGNLP